MSFNFTNTNMPGKTFSGISQAAQAAMSKPGAPPPQATEQPPAAPQGFGALVANARARQQTQAMAMPATPVPMNSAQPLVAPPDKGGMVEQSPPMQAQESPMQARQFSDSANPTGFNEAASRFAGRMGRRLR